MTTVNWIDPALNGAAPTSVGPAGGYVSPGYTPVLASVNSLFSKSYSTLTRIENTFSQYDGQARRQVIGWTGTGNDLVLPVGSRPNRITIYDAGAAKIWTWVRGQTDTFYDVASAELTASAATVVVSDPDAGAASNYQVLIGSAANPNDSNPLTAVIEY